MEKKITIFAYLPVLISFCFFLINFRGMNEPSPNFTDEGNSIRHKAEFPGENNINNRITTYPLIEVTDVYTGEWTYYDLQSNGSSQHIWQDPNIPGNIHLVFMWNQTLGLPSANRRTKYVFSDDTGSTWTSLGEVPAGASSGFPACHGLSDGRIVIANHSSPTPPARTHVYVDITAGGGSFTTCDPGTDGVLEKIWPRLTTVASNRVVFVTSKNTAADSLAYTNALTNLTNCTFTGYVCNTDMNNAENYSIATSDNGLTVGLVYISNDNNSANMSDVKYISSADGGLTWNPPVTVFDAQPGPNLFLGAFNGIDIVFSDNQPRVVFELGWLTDMGGYFPGLCSKIMYWSPAVNGGVPVVIVDSTKLPCNQVNGWNNALFSFTRPTIGKAHDNSALFTAFNVAREDFWPPDSTPYFDVYLCLSINDGLSWAGYWRLTNLSGPLRDCRYPNIAPVNVSNAHYNAYIEYQNDSIPGSYVSGSDPSRAEQHFINVKFFPPDGIETFGNEIPEHFALHQNYPNPFNSVTKIRFDISTPLNPPTRLRNGQEGGKLAGTVPRTVRLIIYDILGREAAELVNEPLAPGTYEVEWNATNFTSGVYFLVMEAGEFRDIKKAVLLK